jgi:hypothetical protein
VWVSAWVSTPPTTIIDDGLDSILAFGIVNLAILSGNRNGLGMTRTAGRSDKTVTRPSTSS